MKIGDDLVVLVVLNRDRAAGDRELCQDDSEVRELIVIVLLI